MCIRDRDNALHYFSVNSNEKGKESNYENDGAKGKDAVAIGPNAIAGNMKSVAIGYNAKVEGNGGNDEGGGSVAIGENSLITTNGLDFPSIAIGKNSKVLNGSGKQEGVLSFGNSKYAGGIVLGENSYARTGSIQIGSHTYSGLMGGINVNNATNEEANIVNMTTIGTNSYQKGAMGTTVSYTHLTLPTNREV